MRRTILALTTTGALAFAGCGGDSGADDGNETAARPNDEAQLAFARCMRENGVDMPDPKSEGDGPTRVEIGRNVSPQVVERATRTCRDKTGGGPPELSQEQREELQDGALKFARCMRRNGVDVPDPQVRGGGGAVLFGPGAGERGKAPNRESPAFQRAMEACREHMPRIGPEEGK